MQSVLNYAAPRGPDPHRKLLRAAYICGVTPMCVGVTILTAFAATKISVLILAGMFWIVAGFFIVLIGFGCAIKYRQRCEASQEQGEMGPMPRRWPALLLLWLNFPIAYLCFGFGVMLAKV